MCIVELIGCSIHIAITQMSVFHSNLQFTISLIIFTCPIIQNAFVDICRKWGILVDVMHSFKREEAKEKSLTSFAPFCSVAHQQTVILTDCLQVQLVVVAKSRPSAILGQFKFFSRLRNSTVWQFSGYIYLYSVK